MSKTFFDAVLFSFPHDNRDPYFICPLVSDVKMTRHENNYLRPSQNCRPVLKEDNTEDYWRFFIKDLQCEYSVKRLIPEHY